MGCLHPRPGYFVKPDDHGIGPDGEPCVNSGKRMPPLTEGEGPVNEAADKAPCRFAAGEEVPPGDRLLNEGHAGRAVWKLRSRGGAFTGEVLVSGALAASFTGADSEGVMQRMLAFVDGVVDPRDTRAYAAPRLDDVAVGDPRLARVAGMLGLGAMDRHLARVIDDVAFAAHRRRRAATTAVLDWLESSRKEWDESPALRGDPNRSTIAACRALMDRQVAVLFELIGGAL
jgi:hypothetical protein